mmetsp:Transcript_37756/g.86354  ORF Transcript_37756/g.86354 Transcript_37756/m.86354 type:complete len:120 (+) Transcript_37756:57-416(+)
MALSLPALISHNSISYSVNLLAQALRGRPLLTLHETSTTLDSKSRADSTYHSFRVPSSRTCGSQRAQNRMIVYTLLLCSTLLQLRENATNPLIAESKAHARGNLWCRTMGGAQGERADG